MLIDEMRIRYFFLVSVLFLLLFVVAGHETTQPHNEGIPPNIQKLVDYNAEQAKFYFKNLSFLVAFLIGIIAILSPCSLAILPSFFAYTFGEKKNIAKMTSVFFLGFAPVFIFLGMVSAYLGQTISVFQQNNKILVILSGVFVVIFGVMTFFGKGFSGIRISRRVSNNVFGIFLFGVFFAIGFTACMGPALFGILLIAGTLKSYLYASFLMLFYSLGLFSTLFVTAYFFDKYNFSNALNKLNKKIGFSLTNVLSGVLLIILGSVFIFYGGTSVLKGFFGLGSFTVKIYSLMDKIILSKISNYFGGGLLVLFFIFLWRVIVKKWNAKKNV